MSLASVSLAEGRKVKSSKQYAVLFLLTSILLFLSSCGMKASRSSFAASLDNIDALIARAETGEALKELGKAEKNAGDPFSRIGIFRRYMALGEKVLAERVINKAMRRFRGNQELTAVYAHFLLREGRLEKALKAAKPLIGTAYGAIYSEAYFTQLFLKEKDELPSFSDDSLFPMYYDAYTGTGEQYWLRNCAVIRLMQENYAGAVQLSPNEYFDALDAYFWALVSFDNKQFGKAAYLADLAAEIYNRETSGGKDVLNVSLLEITAILSDAYISAGDDESAEKARQKLLTAMGDGSNEDNDYEQMREKLLPVIYLNSALYAQSHGDDHKCLELLNKTVNTWSDYVPALIAYSAFACRTSSPFNEDAQEIALRESGVRTLRMEKYDNSPRVSILDARTRMEESLERTYNTELYIALLNLRYATDKTLTIENKIADVWDKLERSATGANIYPPMLLEFAVNKLLSFGETEDAWTLFSKSIASEYKFDQKHDFWEQCVKNVSNFTLSEAEFAAYFAAAAKNTDVAKRLLDYCVYESGGEGGDAKKVSAFVSTATCMNLAMLCSSTGEKRRALDIYAASSGRAANIKDKAEAMRRMAAIYIADGKMKEAKQSIGYALTLDPHNMKARLLLDRMSDPLPRS